MQKRNFSQLKALDERKLTQGSVARSVGISETRFTRIVRNYVEPTETEIRDICKALRMARDDLGFGAKS